MNNMTVCSIWNCVEKETHYEEDLRHHWTRPGRYDSSEGYNYEVAQTRTIY